MTTKQQLGCSTLTLLKKAKQDLKKQKVKDAGELAERAAKEVVGIKSLRYGKKTNDPSRLDHAEGMRRELEEELGIEPVEEARDEQRFEEERGDS